MMTSAVVASGLRISRGGRDVLHGLDVTVPRGIVCGLLGPSGGGKTTLLRAVVGVQAGVTGRIDVLGRPAGSPDLRRRIGYVTQSPAVYGDLSVRHNLEYFADVLGVGRARVEQVLRDVARTKFQAVQFLPAVVLPQVLLCGLFAPRDAMAAPLRWLSDVFPLTYAVDGMQRVSASPDVPAALLADLGVIGSCVVLFVTLGAVTLPRRSA